jgi:hypothetical protein
MAGEAATLAWEELTPQELLERVEAAAASDRHHELLGLRHLAETQARAASELGAGAQPLDLGYVAVAEVCHTQLASSLGNYTPYRV